MCCHFDFTANEERLLGNECAPEIPAFFDHLRQFCNDGMDSFKVDPNRMVDTSDETKIYANGRTEAEMHSLHQTLLVKEMYMGAKNQRGNVRPMHHYCGGFTGTNAYTATNTGDTGGGLNTLAWTLNTGLSGFSNVTCDMNIFDPKGIHYAFFTGWCQLNSWAGFEHPWWAGDKNFEFFKFYDIMRFALMPYIYTHSIEANNTGTPICRALPLMYKEDAAKNLINEFMFGDYLLVGAFSDKIYLPEGYTWYDAWTGKVYEGGQEITPVIPEDRGGMLFIRSGAIIPTEAPKQFEDNINTPNLILNLYPSGKSEYTMYEDDGVTFDYEQGERVATHFEMADNGAGCTITIADRVGSFKGMTENRTYSANVRLNAAPASVKVDGADVAFTYADNFAKFEIGAGKVVEIVYGA
jgi:alpha-glucosidase (family GH31 glycosyl hydrolase)